MKNTLARLVVAAVVAFALVPGASSQKPPTAPADCEKADSPVTFKAEADVQKVTEAYPLDAVDFAKSGFHITLDWTDASIEKVETMLDSLYRDKAKSEPSGEDVWQMSKVFGSYVGEVYRRNYGATWGIVTMGGDSIVGIQTKSCGLFWPWGKVQNRLSNGSEDNVWYYYQTLLIPRSS